MAVAPISGELRADLGVGAGAIGVLTSLPVLCFGLLAPLALLVVRRAGPELAIAGCLSAVVVGSVVRSSGSYGLAITGTLVIGLGITIGNIVTPVLIRRETTPRSAGIVTGVYVSAMNVGSMTVTLATAPLAEIAGWRFALGTWGLLGIAGLGGWALFLRHRRATAPTTGPTPGPATGPATGPAAASAGPTTGPTEAEAPIASRSPWRLPLAWMLGLAFAGQATSYYAITAWLPTLLADEIGLGAAAAGSASSVFQVCAIIGALGVPLLALRCPAWATIGLVGLLWMSFPVQLLVAPEAYLLGSVLGGIAQGGGFAAIFTVVVQISRSDRESAQLSAFVQGVGYVVAATGPTALGLAHDATDAWTVPVLLVVGTTAMFTVLGVAAGLTQARQAAGGIPVERAEGQTETETVSGR